MFNCFFLLNVHAQRKFIKKFGAICASELYSAEPKFQHKIRLFKLWNY
jgi:hypothetical protein